MLNGIINLGIPVGITAKVSELYSSKEEDYIARINSYWAFFIKLILILSFSIVLLLVFFSNPFTNALVGSTEYNLLFIIIILGVPFTASYSIIDGFLKSFGAISTIVRISVIATILSTLVLIPLVIYFNVIGVALSIFFLGLLPMTIFAIKYRKQFRSFFRFKDLIQINLGEKWNVLKIGIVSIAAALMHQGAIILMRRLIISEFGEVDNGIYQSVLGISLNYFAIIYAFLSNYTLPKISSIKDNFDLVTELNGNLRFLMVIIVPSILLIFSFRDIVLQLVYTKEFLEAKNLFLFQLIGDVFRMLAALFGLWLIPKMKIIPLLIIDFVFNALLIILPFSLVTFWKHDLMVFPLVYMIAFFFHFIMYFVYTKKIIKFRFTNDSIKTLLYGALIVLFGFSLSSLTIEYGHVAVFILLGSWFFLVFNKEEKKSLMKKINSFFSR